MRGLFLLNSHLASSSLRLACAAATSGERPTDNEPFPFGRRLVFFEGSSAGLEEEDEATALDEVVSLVDAKPFASVLDEVASSEFPEAVAL